MKNGLSWLDYLHALKEEIKEMFLPASHKITKMGKGVTKRTRKFRDSFSIRMQLNEKEDEIEKYYLELGHRFYADHADTPPAEYLDCMNAIRGLQEEIIDAREQLKLLQGIRLCPECQKENPIDAVFCAYCGHAFPPLLQETVQEEENPVCPQCGEQMAPDAMFCIKCGYKIEKNPVPPIYTSPSAAPVQRVSEQEEEKEPAAESTPAEEAALSEQTQTVEQAEIQKEEKDSR